MKTIIFFITINLFAQYLNIDSQVKLGTGIKALSWNGEVGYKRSYTNLMFDTSFIIDKDKTFQYGFSIDLDLETRMSLTPGVYIKLDKNIYNKTSLFAIGGITYMIIPKTIFGFRIGFGSNYMLLDYLGFIFEMDIEPLLFGSGLNGRMATEIKILLGVNLLF